MGDKPDKIRRGLLIGGAAWSAASLAKFFGISSAEAADLTEAGLSSVISSLSRGKDFLGLAESGTRGRAHKDVALSEFYSSPEFLDSLKVAGFTKIGHEFLDTGFNGILRDYFDGKISDPAMEYFIAMATPLGLQGENNAQPNATTRIQANLYKMIKNAKEKGIRVVGVSAFEGFGEKEVINQLIQMKTVSDYALLQAIQENEKLFFNTELAPDTLKRYRFLKVDYYIKQAFDASAATNPLLQDPAKRDEIRKLMLSVYGLADEVPDLDLEGVDVIQRLVLDRDVAKRVVASQQQDGGGKMLVVYGNAHFLRARGDIDFHVGDRRMPVLEITSDDGDTIAAYRRALVNEDNDQLRAILSRLERADATLRIHDSAGFLKFRDGTQIQVTGMPHIPSLKVPIPQRRPTSP